MTPKHLSTTPTRDASDIQSWVLSDTKSKMPSKSGKAGGKQPPTILEHEGSDYSASGSEYSSSEYSDSESMAKGKKFSPFD